MQSSNASQPFQVYQLRVREYLDDDIAMWLSPFTVSHEPNGTTTLTGPVRDQAELHGLLMKIRDLNLTLILVIIK